MKKIVLLLLIFMSQISLAQIVNIPDANFKAALIEAGVDTNGDGEIQVSEAENTINLSLLQENIQSVEGIASFINLRELNLSFNELDSHEIHDLPNLEYLYLSGNDYITLQISNLPKLIYLQCDRNDFLTSLAFSNAPELKYIDCSHGLISNLDVSELLKLEELKCVDNELVTLQLPNPSNLNKLSTQVNNLVSLDLSTQSNLKSLYASHNNLTSLDLPSSSQLDTLYCGFNEINSLDLSNQTELKRVLVKVNNLTSLDFSNSTQLNTVFLESNNLTSLNFSNCTELEQVFGSYNNLTSIDLTSNINLVTLKLAENNLTDIDLSNNTKLKTIYLYENQLTSLDVSNVLAINQLDLERNQLESLNIKNGHNDQVFISGNEGLNHICVDSDEIESVLNLVESLNYTNCVVNPFCTFEPGGDVYYIQGNVKVDIGQDGCDADDIVFPFLQLKVEDTEGNLGIFNTESDGSYGIPIQSGSYNVTYQSPYLTYFDLSPTSFSVDFPTDASPFIQDICLTPNGSYNDLQVTMIPLDEARPGFDAHYKVIYANVGTNALSGDVTLNFDDDVMDLVSSSTNPDTQSTGELSWTFSNLTPLESKTIDIVMNLNTPTETPPLNGDEILCYTLNISHSANDEVPYDNTFNLKQTVVNSYDPNDKTCLEGNVITPDLVGEYVHYLIRFENTGTASAINVVIRDVIDTNKFDMDSFVPMDASHDFVTRIQNDNEVEFIFEGIELPFDDANNDGYVLFKIKTLPTLEVGDTFENSAEIYFDFNFPIITNIEQTTVDIPASTDQFALNSKLKVFPNPAENYVTIESQLAFDSVLIHDLTGKEVKRIVSIESRLEQNIEVSNLKSGIYYLTIRSGNLKTTHKFLKR